MIILLLVFFNAFKRNNVKYQEPNGNSVDMEYLLNCRCFKYFSNFYTYKVNVCMHARKRHICSDGSFNRSFRSLKYKYRSYSYYRPSMCKSLPPSWFEMLFFFFSFFRMHAQHTIGWTLHRYIFQTSKLKSMPLYQTVPLKSIIHLVWLEEALQSISNRLTQDLHFRLDYPPWSTLMDNCTSLIFNDSKIVEEFQLNSNSNLDLSPSILYFKAVLCVHTHIMKVFLCLNLKSRICPMSNDHWTIMFPISCQLNS